MWSTTVSISSSDSTMHDPAASIFTPPQLRSRAYSQLTPSSTVVMSVTKHLHVRSTSQSFSPSPLRRSTDLLASEPKQIDLQRTGSDQSFPSINGSARGSFGTDNEDHEDSRPELRGRNSLFSSSTSAATTSCSPPMSTISSHPPASFRHSISLPLTSATDTSTIPNHTPTNSYLLSDLISQIRTTTPHCRRESESSSHCTPIRRALGTSEAYDAAAQAALSRRLDGITLAIRASTDLSPLAVANLHAKLDDLEETLYNPSSSRAHFEETMDTKWDERQIPGNALKKGRARMGSVDGEGSVFGKRFSDLSAFLRERPGSPVKGRGSRTGTPTPIVRQVQAIVQETPEEEEEEDDEETDGSDSDNEESSDDGATKQADNSKAPHFDHAIANSIIHETTLLNAKLESLINNLRARQEESSHIQTLLLSRAERAAQRVLFLQGRVEHLEEELQENDSELAFLRLCVKAVEVMVPREAVDEEMWGYVQGFKREWRAVKERRERRKREMAEGNGVGGGQREVEGQMHDRGYEYEYERMRYDDDEVHNEDDIFRR